MAPRLWSMFFGLAAAWNFLGAYRMLFEPSAFLGDTGTDTVAGFFVTLTGVLLAVLGAATALIAYDQNRYAPLTWLAAFGRISAGYLMITYTNRGILPERVIVPGVTDIAFGVIFLTYAVSRLITGAPARSP